MFNTYFYTLQYKAHKIFEHPHILAHVDKYSMFSRHQERWLKWYSQIAMLLRPTFGFYGTTLGFTPFTKFKFLKQAIVASAEICNLRRFATLAVAVNHLSPDLQPGTENSINLVQPRLSICKILKIMAIMP